MGRILLSMFITEGKYVRSSVEARFATDVIEGRDKNGRSRGRGRPREAITEKKWYDELSLTGTYRFEKTKQRKKNGGPDLQRGLCSIEEE